MRRRIRFYGECRHGIELDGIRFGAIAALDAISAEAASPAQFSACFGRSASK
jgi:hypothetical protein